MIKYGIRAYTNKGIYSVTFLAPAGIKDPVKAGRKALFKRWGHMPVRTWDWFFAK